MKKILLSLLFFSLLAACSKDSESALTTGKSGSITRFAVYQQYMYVLNLNEVQTYDIADADHPKLVHTLVTDYGLETITIYENTIFLGSTTALYILDITTNPAAPSILSKADRVIVGFSGCDPVAVKGNYAYSTIKIIPNVCGVSAAESALVVYDVTDKTNPKLLRTYPLSMPNGLAYKGNYLFVCDEGSDEVTVFDITDPTDPTPTEFDIPVVDPYDLIVADNKMIVSTKTDFLIFDISDVTDIRKIGTLSK